MVPSPGYSTEQICTKGKVVHKGSAAQSHPHPHPG